MDTSSLKDILQKLSFVKNYSYFLLPVIIGLVGLLLFVPTYLMSGSLVKQIAKESVSKGKKIKSLSSSAVARDQWKIEEKYQVAYERDANQVAVKAKQSSQRELLSYNIFPAPTDSSMLIFDEFGQRFCEKIDIIFAGFNSGLCPTQAELEKSIESSLLGRSSRRRSSTGMLGLGMPGRSMPGRGMPGRGMMGPGMMGQGMGRTMYANTGGEVGDTIRDVICLDKATSISVYADGSELELYKFWDKSSATNERAERGSSRYVYKGRDIAVKWCWYTQAGYWIIEDVIETIGAINAGSNSVLTSPVKRLMNISFAGGAGGNTGEDDMSDRPVYVLSTDEGIVEPYTGRICDTEIDVVHFTVSVIVRTKSVLAFMNQLCSSKEHKFSGFSGIAPEQVSKHNQITILESSIVAIEREDGIHGLYRYGDDATVRLDLVCEYIFNKSGYDGIMPEPVKKNISGDDEEKNKRY